MFLSPSLSPAPRKSIKTYPQVKIKMIIIIIIIRIITEAELGGLGGDSLNAECVDCTSPAGLQSGSCARSLLVPFSHEVLFLLSRN